MEHLPEAKSAIVSHLVLVANAYCAGSGSSRNAVSKQLFDRGGQIDALAAGRRDVNTATFERAMKWLSDNWPADAAWPDDVDRPARSIEAVDVRPGD
jgi:hypothetical protein